MGYTPVNGLKMYYEVHGSGDPVVLLHGSFMTITNNWTGWIRELSKTRKVIAVEMQGHGRTADIEREFSYEALADDVAALLDHLRIPRAGLIGYSMGGGVAMQCAIRHPEKVRKVVSISAVFRHDGWVQEALDAFPKLTPEAFKGSPIETEYKKLSPTPDEFPRILITDNWTQVGERLKSRRGEDPTLQKRLFDLYATDEWRSFSARARITEVSIQVNGMNPIEVASEALRRLVCLGIPLRILSAAWPT